ncbi:MAG: acyl-CoA dehydrogenase [Gammaproteobacteria bacterium]|nr:acyl-CoA dehydrogenase [Gammaproteobacteria bacterium]
MIGITLVLITVWRLAYKPARPVVWITAIPTLLITLQLSYLLTLGLAIFFWAIYAICLTIYMATKQRRQWISAPLLHQFRKVMPRMSKTEQEALDAGDVWWDGELFSGSPNWDQLLHYPKSELSSEEQAYIDGTVNELCQMLDDWQITHHDQAMPPKVWNFIKDSGLFGMIIPKDYGGLEFSALAHSTIVMKIASKSIAAAVTVMVPNSLGPAKLLLHYGTEEQKERYLYGLASGSEVPCFALTGPKAGSDAGAIPDLGIVTEGTYKGKKTLGIRLNWEKRYITLAPVATLIGLAFKLEDPNHLLGDIEDLGVTLALIPRRTKGVEVGERHMPLNIPFQNGPTRGRDVFIPMEFVIGGQERVGQGWRMLMENLSEGRGISLPALSTGAGKMASRYTGAYAAVRQQFGMPIGRFEGIEEALARIAGMTYQMEATRQLTLDALDSGKNPSVISAIIKYHTTERYRQVINDAMDIQGGSGICLGPSNLWGRAYQAIPIAITVEGANILTRSMIIFGQGAIRCHPHILGELEAVNEDNEELAVRKFDKALFNHIFFVIANIARTLWLGLSHGRLSRRPVSGVAGLYFQRLNWMSAAFALSADVALMTLGGALKRKERLSARLGDLLSELYIASATLKHFVDQGKLEQELPLMQWAMENSLYRMQEALRGLFRNLPLRPLAWILRFLVFPTGLRFHHPTDRMDKAAAKLLLQPNETRDRLTQHIYTSRNPDERVGLLDLALEAASAAAPVEKILRDARHAGKISRKGAQGLVGQALEQGVINQDQADKLARAEELRDQVIQVDAFKDLKSKATPKPRTKRAKPKAKPAAETEAP